MDQQTKNARLTRTGEFVGTLAYASPEQLDGSSTLDTRSDVYALGVVLYELLTESLPNSRTASLPMLLDQIRTTRPPSPTVINPNIDSDLSAVVMRAIAREPERRYQSMADFGADLTNYLNNRPVVARADSRWYLICSEIKLRRIPIGAALIILIASVAFGIFATTQSRLLSNRNAALVDALSRESVERAGLLAQTGSLVGAERLLWPLHIDGSDRAMWALRDLYTRFPVHASVQLPIDPGPISVLDKQFFIFVDRIGKTISRIDLYAPNIEHIMDVGDARGVSVKDDRAIWITADGTVLENRFGSLNSQSEYGRIDLSDAEPVVGLRGSAYQPWIYADNEFSLYSALDQKWIKLQIEAGVSILQINSTETGFVLLCDDLTLRSIDEFGNLLQSIASGPVGRSRTKIATTQDCKHIAQVTDSDIRLFQQGREEPIHLIEANGWIEAVCFVQPETGPDLFVACSADNLLRIWRLDTNELVLECSAFDTTPTHVQSIPGQSGIITIEESGLIRAWDLAQMIRFQDDHSSQETGLDLELDPRTQSIAMGVDGLPHRFLLFDQKTLNITASLDWDAPICATSRGANLGEWYFADYNGGIACVVQTPDGLELLWRRSLLQHPNAIALAPDGDKIAVACDKGIIEILDSISGSSVARIALDATRVPSISWHPDLDLIAICTYPESDLIIISDPAGPAHLSVMYDGPPQLGARTVAFSPDGKLIALGGDDSLIRVWGFDNTINSSLAQKLSGHNEGLFTLDFSADGKHLVSAGRSGRIVVWDTRTAEPLARITASDRMLFSARFSLNGRSIFTTGIGSKIYEWNLDVLDNSLHMNHLNRKENMDE